MAFDALRGRLGAQAAAHGEARGARHADRNALAVDQARAVVIGQALEGVAERVTEVEQRPFALLHFVPRDDRRLGLAAHRDGANLFRLTMEHRVRVGVEPIEEPGVADQAIFHDFGVAGAELAQRQGPQRVDVGENQRRAGERRRSNSCHGAN